MTVTPQLFATLPPHTQNILHHAQVPVGGTIPFELLKLQSVPIVPATTNLQSITPNMLNLNNSQKKV